MNYAIVAVGALLLLVILGWFAWGKDTFKGADDVVEIAFEPVVSIGISICEVGANRIVEINISSSVED